IWKRSTGAFNVSGTVMTGEVRRWSLILLISCANHEWVGLAGRSVLMTQVSVPAAAVWVQPLSPFSTSSLNRIVVSPEHSPGSLCVVNVNTALDGAAPQALPLPTRHHSWVLVGSAAVGWKLVTPALRVCDRMTLLNPASVAISMR